MSETKGSKFRATEYLGCFGGFRSGDRVCRNYCSINILCSIEADQKLRLDFLEELFEEEDLLLSTH